MPVSLHLIQGLRLPVLLECQHCGHPGLMLEAEDDHCKCSLRLKTICPSCQAEREALVEQEAWTTL